MGARDRINLAIAQLEVLKRTVYRDREVVAALGHAEAFKLECAIDDLGDRLRIDIAHVDRFELNGELSGVA